VLLREVKLPEQEAATLRNLSSIYTALNRVPDAVKALQQALELETRLQNVSGQLITRERLGGLYTQVGAFPEALKTLQEALTLAQPLKNEDLIAILQSQIAEVQERAGQWPEALKSYEVSLDLLQKSTQADRQSAVVDLLTRIANLHERLGQYQPASDRYQQAVAKVSPKDQPFVWGQMMISLAQVYQLQENWVAALDTYKKALGQIEPLKVPLAQAQLLRGMATVYQQQKDFSRALATAQKALTLDQSVKNQGNVSPQNQQQEEGLTLMVLGDIYRQQKQYDQALGQYQAAHTAFTTAQDPTNQGEALRNLGITHLLKNTPQEAIQPLLTAVQLWELLSYQSGVVLDPTLEAHQLLQSALLRAKKIDLALASAEDERSFPQRLQQVWQSQLREKPIEPLSIEQIRTAVTQSNQPFIFYDITTDLGETDTQTIPKLRIWIIPVSGDLTFRELPLSSVNIQTPEDLLGLIKDSKTGKTEATKRLSDLLLKPIALDLNALSVPGVQLIIPPILQEVLFSDLDLTTTEGKTQPLKERFRVSSALSILQLTQKTQQKPQENK
jgi:tetratricopeptide (TPR) repeat protein